MNERIRELARKAQVGSAEFGNGINYFVSTEETFNKFAELIIKECIKFCEHEFNDDEYDEHDTGMWIKAQSIKTAIMEHFGVEE